MNFRIIAIFFLITMGFSQLKTVKAQSRFPNEIKKAFVSGDSKKLALYFDRNVELLLIDKGDVYSKAQAELIIKNFFVNNSPKSFIVESESKDNTTNFAIARLKTHNNNFRIFITYRKNSQKPIVNQMVISQVQKMN
ncbi:MAG: DUF4783 domain-containing protein [Bacteroidota bacterium]